VSALALPLYAEPAVHHGHSTRLRTHARQGELDDVGAVFDPSLRGGKPGRTLRRLLHGAAHEPLEQVIGGLMKVELVSGRPAKHGIHCALLTYSHLDNMSCIY